MKEISKRANILYRNYKGKDIIIYEDHRFTVNALYYYYQKTNTKHLNAFIFDKHCDLRDITDVSKQYITENPKATFQELYNFVEFQLSEDDNDWCKAAMEMQLLKNYHLLFAERIRNVNETSYSDFKGNIHSIQYINKKEINNLKSHIDLLNTPFFLDFDLDCFSYYSKDTIKAMNLSEIKKHIDYDTNVIFFKTLVNKASFISICFESDHCGGFNESRKIFNSINKLFFDNQL